MPDSPSCRPPASRSASCREPSRRQTPDPVAAILGSRSTRYEGPAPRSAIIAVATRVDRPAIRLTNAHWTVDADAIGRALGLDRVTLVNDYTPVAASVMVLDEARGDLAPLGDDGRRGRARGVVLGPGTGFGAGVLMPVEDQLAIVATEAGHVEFGPAEPRRWRSGRISNGSADASPPRSCCPARAFSASPRALVGAARPEDAVRDPQRCPCGRPAGRSAGTEVLDLFARWLGRFAGDLALTFEASGGVFIAGGIAPRMVDILQQGEFRRRLRPQGAARRLGAAGACLHHHLPGTGAPRALGDRQPPRKVHFPVPGERAGRLIPRGVGAGGKAALTCMDIVTRRLASPCSHGAQRAQFPALTRHRGR